MYTLIFVAPVNYFIRAAIERGAEGGLAKNFAQLIEVLGRRMPVQTAEQAAAAVAAQVRRPLLSSLSCTLTASNILVTCCKAWYEMIAVWMLRMVAGTPAVLSVNDTLGPWSNKRVCRDMSMWDTTALVCHRLVRCRAGRGG